MLEAFLAQPPSLPFRKFDCNGQRRWAAMCIGTTAPATTLDVRNALGTSTIASISGNLIVMANGGWGGNVGIGTTTPVQRLMLEACLARQPLPLFPAT